MLRERGAVGWAGVLLSGAAVSAVVPAAFFSVVWRGVGPPPDPRDALLFLPPALAAGAAAAVVARLLGFGRTTWARMWEPGGKIIAALLLGGFVGFWVAYGTTGIFWRLWEPMDPTRSDWADAFAGIWCVVLGTLGAALAALVCPLLWAGWAAWRTRKAGVECPPAPD